MLNQALRKDAAHFSAADNRNLLSFKHLMNLLPLYCC